MRECAASGVAVCSRRRYHTSSSRAAASEPVPQVAAHFWLFHPLAFGQFFALLAAVFNLVGHLSWLSAHRRSGKPQQRAAGCRKAGAL